MTGSTTEAKLRESLASAALALNDLSVEPDPEQETILSVDDVLQSTGLDLGAWTDASSFGNLMGQVAQTELDRRAHQASLQLVLKQIQETPAAVILSIEEQLNDYRTEYNAIETAHLAYARLYQLKKEESNKLLEQLNKSGRRTSKSRREDGALVEQLRWQLISIGTEYTKLVGRPVIELDGKVDTALNRLTSLQGTEAHGTPSLQTVQDGLQDLSTSIQGLNNSMMDTGQEISAEIVKMRKSLDESLGGQMSFTIGDLDISLESTEIEEFVGHTKIGPKRSAARTLMESLLMDVSRELSESIEELKKDESKTSDEIARISKKHMLEMMRMIKHNEQDVIVENSLSAFRVVTATVGLATNIAEEVALLGTDPLGYVMIGKSLRTLIKTAQKACEGIDKKRQHLIESLDALRGQELVSNFTKFRKAAKDMNDIANQFRVVKAQKESLKQEILTKEQNTAVDVTHEAINARASSTLLSEMKAKLDKGDSYLADIMSASAVLLGKVARGLGSKINAAKASQKAHGARTASLHSSGRNLFMALHDLSVKIAKDRDTIHAYGSGEGRTSEENTAIKALKEEVEDYERKRASLLDKERDIGTAWSNHFKLQHDAMRVIKDAEQLSLKSNMARIEQFSDALTTVHSTYQTAKGAHDAFVGLQEAEFSEEAFDTALGTLADNLTDYADLVVAALEPIGDITVDALVAIGDPVADIAWEVVSSIWADADSILS